MSSDPDANNPVMAFDPGAVDLMLEMGPSTCNSVEECRAALSTVETSKLTPAAVARIMIGMLKAHENNQAQQDASMGSSSLWGDFDYCKITWNGKVFVQALLEVVPSLKWVDVFAELDFPGFMVEEGRFFRCLMDTLKFGLQVQKASGPEQFPIDSFYRKWNNSEGQLSLIRCCLNASNVDIFSFADYPTTSIQTEMLKSPDDKSYDSKEIQTWKSIQLLELLSWLSDTSQFAYGKVLELFQYPLHHCPDILILGLTQLGSPINMLCQELLQMLFPIFLNNHVNSAVILHQAWNSGSASIRPLMTHLMAEWYLGGELGGSSEVTDPAIFSEIQSGDISKEAEDEADSYFHRIYSKPLDPTMSIEEVLDLLKRFQESSIKRDREVFQCMLRNLFDEYKLFPQYPDKELHATAQLFSGITEHGLVSNFMQFGVALGFVMDALKKSPGSKIYFFGLAALDRFKSRLKEYPQYCQHLSTIPHFQQFPENLIEFIEHGIRSQEPSRNRPSLPSTSSLVNPPEKVQDKTAFIFINLNQMNLTQKCEELKDVIGGDHWPWVAQYLIMKRASIEINSHTLYSNLLDALRANYLNLTVLKETHRNIKILLKTDKSAGNFADRKLLKNLGHWLGMITIMRNKLLDDLDIKSLLIEAYRKGLQDLLYVVPFAAKIMESCARSLLFKPPCPWTIAILNVLAELHREPDMKLNLKFEIDVLCKALTIEFADLKPKGLLKDETGFKIHMPQLSYPQQVQTGERLTERPAAAARQNNIQSMLANFSLENKSRTISPAVHLDEPAPSSTVQIGSTLGAPQQHLMSITPTLPMSAHDPKFSYVDPTNLNNHLPHIVINNGISLLQNRAALKTYIRPAVEKAIQDLLGPVVDRSIKYTINACEHIIKKDFALDHEEGRMRNGTHHLIRYITAGVAMITSREHIFIAISTNLKQAFTTAPRELSMSPQMKKTIEQAARAIAADNVELASVFIQKTAVEQALVDIDKRLHQEYEHRKLVKQEGRRYYDSVMMSYQNDRIPEAIRVKQSPQGAPLAKQLAVYEDFTRNIPGFLPPTDGELAMAGIGEIVPGVGRSHLHGDELLSIYEKLLSEIQNYFEGLSMTTSQNAAQLASGIRSLMEGIMSARSTRSVVGAIGLLSKAVEGLLEGLAAFPSDPEIIRFRDAHLMVLKALQDTRAFGQAFVNRQVTKCLLEVRPELKYNIEAVQQQQQQQQKPLSTSPAVNIYDPAPSPSTQNCLPLGAPHESEPPKKPYVLRERKCSYVKFFGEIPEKRRRKTTVKQSNTKTKPIAQTATSSKVLPQKSNTAEKRQPLPVPKVPTYVPPLWPNRTVIFEISRGLTMRERCMVLQNMEYISEETSIVFRKKKSEDVNYVQIVKSDRNDSYVGMVGGNQKLNLINFCDSTIRHELCHAIGLNHEHQRFDRDLHIIVHPERMTDEWKRWIVPTVDFNTFGVRYDTESIMHYRPTAGSKDQKTAVFTSVYRNKIFRGAVLTEQDVLKIERMYRHMPYRKPKYNYPLS